MTRRTGLPPTRATGVLLACAVAGWAMGGCRRPVGLAGLHDASPAPPLVIRGNEWTYRGTKLHFMDRVERWEAALGPPSRRVAKEGSLSLVWDDLGIAVTSRLTPDRRAYVDGVHLDLGDAAQASPMRRHEHEKSEPLPAQGYRDRWEWNGVVIEAGRVDVKFLRYAMKPPPFHHHGSEALVLSEYDPDAFPVEATANLACLDPQTRPNCTEYIDEIEFRANLGYLGY